MKEQKIVAASILNADFLNLQKDLEKISNFGVKWIHFDVMDYHFVPNLSFGPKILLDIANAHKEFMFDCHMMVEIDVKWDLKQYLTSFIVNSQVKMITCHYEALSRKQLQEFLTIDLPCKKALAINPETNVMLLAPYLTTIDQILVMSVQPGFGGQKFIEESLNKIAILANIKREKSYHFTIGVDGGINLKYAKMCIEAGANYLVIGSFLLQNNNIKEMMDWIDE